MHIDPLIVITGFVVGVTVGVTGMGGGALMTPALVLLFNVQPLAAISSDLMAAFVMKPVGGAVHLRRSTVHLGIVKWLLVGSVPSAFCGVLLLREFGEAEDLQTNLRFAIGAALILAIAGLVGKAISDACRMTPSEENGVIEVRPLATVLVGVFGGLIVGMTSVGSGSVMLVLLMGLYPGLTMNRLVGTDLVQAVPLVGAAAVGQLIFGDFRLALTIALLLGSIPGVYLGARLSAVGNVHLIRWAVVVVLAASATKLLGANNTVLAIVVGMVLAIACATGLLMMGRGGRARFTRLRTTQQ
ncbi:MAG: sulfite exporter TauE/SafE family protein [Pseudonocardiaceae bacterium]